MLCVNKLTNLVFNAKKINAKTQFASFFIYLFILKRKQKQPRMKCMNVMQCKSWKKRKKKKSKNNGHKE